ncbi:MAG: Bifunctional sugar kinase/adenylyltransferase [Chlorobi bacterium OLB4]|jgi:ADP-heptose synthase, bifunctional sugar kinase/adenylyltransferase|nr:MAG: Bifunctional sugar kinase/adenylyltransferase [Chlorobi bacterium OLB4]MBW7855304.1 D-glycero-beta-D-manno-heptose-7-phosphate kinase [Ignavibacteria bacterium]OQY77775.1 MAG: D-glycero-beta-D-manno-heptose-7-phosphate kinase [Ignavibacteriales bacterium UTCHB1]
MNTSINSILEYVSERKIYIVGDVMLDRYILGNVNRISPEAPVQVFDLEETSNRLGGAANVALNIKMLGSIPVMLGVIGADESAEILKNAFEKNNIDTSGLITDLNRFTTTKTRLIASSQHLLRIDSESKEDIGADIEDKIVSRLNDEKNEIDIIILQDYNKGVLTKNLISRITAFAKDNEKRVLVDPKFFNFLEYKGAFVFKPNKKELQEAFTKKINTDEELIAVCSELVDIIECKYLVLTLGEKGMIMFSKSNGVPDYVKIPTHARKVADVSGAGDTVVSTLAVCLSGGADIYDAVKISNYAAGMVVEEIGIVPITKDNLIKRFHEL